MLNVPVLKHYSSHTAQKTVHLSGRNFLLPLQHSLELGFSFNLVCADLCTDGVIGFYFGQILFWQLKMCYCFLLALNYAC